MKKKIIELSKLSITFIITIISLFMLLAISYLLPIDTIRNNAYSASNNFKSEGTYYSFYYEQGYFELNMQADNYMDSKILNTASDYNNDLNIFERTVSNKYYENGNGPVESFIETGNKDVNANTNYTRYWFGILTILKPMLLLFSYTSIRYINMIVIFVLLFYSTWLIGKKLHIKYAVTYFISMLLAGIVAVPMSLQFTPLFIITFISTIIILLLYQKEYFKKYVQYLFLIIGCLTAYNDLLTAPLITFGIPIIILVLLKNKYENNTFKDNFLLVIKLGLTWGIAYGMTYFSKWIIASIILNNNEIVIAIEQFLSKTTTLEDNRLQAIYNNLSLYFNKFVICGLLIFLAIYIILIVKKKQYKNINYKNIAILIIIGILPYIWYIVLSNHSYIHFWFTYRIQAITMMALLSSVLSITNEQSKLLEISDNSVNN